MCASMHLFLCCRVEYWPDLWLFVFRMSSHGSKCFVRLGLVISSFDCQNPVNPQVQLDINSKFKEILSVFLRQHINKNGTPGGPKDHWPPISNQFLLKSKWTIFPNFKKVWQSWSWDRTDRQSASIFSQCSLWQGLTLHTWEMNNGL